MIIGMTTLKDTKTPIALWRNEAIQTLVLNHGYDVLSIGARPRLILRELLSQYRINPNYFGKPHENIPALKKTFKELDESFEEWLENTLGDGATIHLTIKAFKEICKPKRPKALITDLKHDWHSEHIYAAKGIMLHLPDSSLIPHPRDIVIQDPYKADMSIQNQINRHFKNK